MLLTLLIRVALSMSSFLVSRPPVNRIDCEACSNGHPRDLAGLRAFLTGNVVTYWPDVSQRSSGEHPGVPLGTHWRRPTGSLHPFGLN